jgi:glycosyltransferase involved in cell wall biosynthesis
VSWILCANEVCEQLRVALVSCLNQTFSDFEIIVIANGENADLVATAVLEWTGGDKRLRIFSTEMRHLVFSLNLGLHLARGSLIARMDSDDIADSHRLGLQVAFMDKHLDVAVLGTAFEYIDGGGRSLAAVNLPTDDSKIRRALRWRNPICHPSVMFRRQVVLGVGGYSGGLHAEDYDLWIRLSVKKDMKFANLSEVCLGYRAIGGEARRSRDAYATIAAAQFRHFVGGYGGIWLLSAVVSALKALMKSSAITRRGA